MSDTILLVEDRADDALFMKRAFAKAKIQHNLTVVSTGRQAIAYLSGDDIYSNRAVYPVPRLVLLDLSLPGISGFEVLRWIRQQPAHIALVVVVLTSSDLPSDIQHAYDLGANSFLSKPSDPSKLTDLVRNTVDHWLK
jgi:CheY-like chemotaxis protein